MTSENFSSSSEIIFHYFPDLTDWQKKQFTQLGELYQSWNEKINLISRKDIGNLYVNHILHSLGIGKVITFLPNTKIVDIGTGGGFPGIPLAILFPACEFLLMDSIGKKITVVDDIIKETGLKNAEAVKARSNEYKGEFDFVVSRAVTSLPEFYAQSSHLIRRGGKNILPNGILYLKGGDVSNEVRELPGKPFIFDLENYFSEEFFKTKQVIHVSV